MMVLPKGIFFTVGIISSFLIQTQGADKYTDGNRPYEFGFNIEGEQHRHESKDEHGLIMGEFGFITADGVYHVTVYATDEQGRFKILSMKNIRVKPYPTYKQPAGSARQGHSLGEQATQATPQELSQTQKPEIPSPNISIEPPGRSCSSCSLPTLTTQASVPAFVQPNTQIVPSRSNDQFRSNDNNFKQNSASVNSQYPNEAKTNSFSSQPNSFNSQNGSPSGLPANQQNNANSQRGPDYSQNTPNQEVVPPKHDTPDYYASGPQSSQPQDFGPDSNTGGRTAKKYEGQQGFNQAQEQPNKPTLISAQMQIVDKNTDIYQRGPGEKEGLPNGLTKSDVTQLLYTFNYTVGFHGHFEEGYRNGAKQGYYFVTGRNGVRTRVDYVADEKGFRPKITQEVLDLLSEDVPKPETEKDEKYGLRGYEFKWLYFPVESNRR